MKKLLTIITLLCSSILYSQTNGTVFVESNDLSIISDTNTYLIIYDSAGKFIFGCTIEYGENTIDISNLSSGMYFIEYRGRTTKFVK